MLLKKLYIVLLLFSVFQMNYNSEHYPFDRYPTIEEIYEDFEKIEEEFGKKDVSVQKIGDTTNNILIKGLLIHYVKKPKSEQKLIVVEGGIHAGRDRLSGIVAHSLVYELLKSTNEGVNKLIKNYNWLIIPFINIDGYIYRESDNEAQKFHKDYHLWIKNMRGYEPPMEVKVDNADETFKNFSICFGVNLDHNWDYMFNNTLSDDTWCSDRYPGDYPFSEKETKHLSNFLIKSYPFGKTWAYIALHSSPERKLMIPYSDCQLTKEHYMLLEIIENAAYDLHIATSRKYRTGTYCNLEEMSSGHSIDWVMNKTGVRFAFIITVPETKYYNASARRVFAVGLDTISLIKKLLENVEKFSKANYVTASVRIVLLVVVLNTFWTLF